MRKLRSLIKKLRNAAIIHLKGNEYYARSMGAKIGNNCSIRTKHFGTEPFLVEIGNNVTLAGDVKLVTHDGSGSKFGRGFRYRKIIIGDNVFIGMNSIVLLGVQIGNNVIVGAGTVLSKSVPSNCVVVGNPARIVTTFDDYVARCKDKFPKEINLVEGQREEQINAILDHSMRPMMK